LPGDLPRLLGVEYVEDLFAPADEDSRTTTNVDGFLAAQHAWIEANLPANGVVLQAEGYGSIKLPPKANRYYGTPGKGGESIGYVLDEQTGQVRTIPFTMPAPATAGRNGHGDAAGDNPTMPRTPRPALTKNGETLVGNMRTDALHAALREEPIDDGRLIALLVLALAGRNVEVKTGMAHAAGPEKIRREIAAVLTEGGAVTSDPAVLRAAARSMLAYTLSCRENWSQSGPVARIGGDAIGADAHLPNMATAEFLSCLSKAAVEGVAVGLDVPVQPTGKATRGAVIARVGEGRWLYPPALFAATETTAMPTGPDEEDTDSDATGTVLAGDDADLDHAGKDMDDAAGEPDTATPLAAEAEDMPGHGEEPTVPARRRRPRKDSGEAQAAA